jgi:hypothetical protein
MKQRYKGQQVPPDQHRDIIYKAINHVLENGGIFSLEVLHLTHEVRIVMDVTERHYFTGNLIEFKSIIMPTFQAEPQSVVPGRKAHQ